MLKRFSFIFLVLFLLSTSAFAQTRSGHKSEIFEGDITTTARDITFTSNFVSYEVCLLNDDAAGEDSYYVLPSASPTVTTITAGMIASAAARETNDVITVKPQETPCLTVNWRGMSIIASGTASYRILVLEVQR